MATMREKLAAASSLEAMRLLNEARPKLFAMVDELRCAWLSESVKLTDRTRDSYADDARRVAKAGGNPLAISGSSASFRKLKAACMWRAREEMREALARANRAFKRDGTSSPDGLCIYADDLPAIAARLSALSSLAFDPEFLSQRDKTHRQRHKLGRMPADWLQKIHEKTKTGKYGAAVAVGILIPVRPDEIAKRVRVSISGDGVMVFDVVGSKVRADGSGVASGTNGIGQESRSIALSAVDPSRQAVFDWLRSQVIESGGRLVVGKGMTGSGISSAFRSMSRRAFPRLKSPPSFYALRHAASAELKAAGDPEQVAKGMGHRSERSAKAYGMRSQARGGYSFEASAPEPVRKPTRKPPKPSQAVFSAKPKGSGHIGPKNRP